MELHHLDPIRVLSSDQAPGESLRDPRLADPGRTLQDQVLLPRERIQHAGELPGGDQHSLKGQVDVVRLHVGRGRFDRDVLHARKRTSHPTLADGGQRGQRLRSKQIRRRQLDRLSAWMPFDPPHVLKVRAVGIVHVVPSHRAPSQNDGTTPFREENVAGPHCVCEVPQGQRVIEGVVAQPALDGRLVNGLPGCELAEVAKLLVVNRRNPPLLEIRPATRARTGSDHPAVDFAEALPKPSVIVASWLRSRNLK